MHHQAFDRAIAQETGVSVWRYKCLHYYHHYDIIRYIRSLCCWDSNECKTPVSTATISSDADTFKARVRGVVRRLHVNRIDYCQQKSITLVMSSRSTDENVNKAEPTQLKGRAASISRSKFGCVSAGKSFAVRDALLHVNIRVPTSYYSMSPFEQKDGHACPVSARKRPENPITMYQT